MQVIWAGSVTRKMQEIARHIARDDPSAAVKMLDILEEAGRSLAKFPFRGREGRVAGTRELQAHKHYFLVYEISANSVEITAIWHTSQQYPPVDTRED